MAERLPHSLGADLPVDAVPEQQAPGEVLGLPQQCQQQMAAVHASVAEGECLAQSELLHSPDRRLAPGGGRRLRCRDRGEQREQLSAQLLQRHPQDP